MARSLERPGLVPATPDNVRRAAELLKQGELVVVPTETVYGVAARADAPAAMARLYAAKGRDAAKRIALFAADLAAARAAGAQADEIAERLAAAFWPGPLTLVLPAAAGEWIGFRCPDHPVALAWLRALDGIVPAVTSANRSGAPAAKTAVEAWDALAPHVALAHDPEGKFDIGALVAKARAWSGLVGLDLAKDVTCAQSYRWDETRWAWPDGYGKREGAGFKVVALDDD